MPVGLSRWSFRLAVRGLCHFLLWHVMKCNACCIYPLLPLASSGQALRLQWSTTSGPILQGVPTYNITLSFRGLNKTYVYQQFIRDLSKNSATLCSPAVCCGPSWGNMPGMESGNSCSMWLTELCVSRVAPPLLVKPMLPAYAITKRCEL